MSPNKPTEPIVNAPVDQDTCEDRMDKVYDKINKVNIKLATIVGGVIVVGFVIPILIALLSTFHNYRFGVSRKKIKK